VEILGTDQEGIDKVMAKIDSITFKPEKGSVYEVKVIKVLDFGAVVEYVDAPGNEVLLHISELAWERTNNVTDVVNMGDVIDVKYFGVDPKTRKEKVSANKKDLQNHLKQMKSFMGGRVGKKELQDAYKYIVSGKMADNIWKSHANAAEVAMFMLYKDKFAKILRSQGVEEGKASLFNKISSPELRSGSKSNYKTKKSGFDIMEFMKE